jgi:hypothetical protein
MAPRRDYLSLAPNAAPWPSPSSEKYFVVDLEARTPVVLQTGYTVLADFAPYNVYYGQINVGVNGPGLTSANAGDNSSPAPTAGIVNNSKLYFPNLAQIFATDTLSADPYIVPVRMRVTSFSVSLENYSVLSAVGGAARAVRICAPTLDPAGAGFQWVNALGGMYSASGVEHSVLAKAVEGMSVHGIPLTLTSAEPWTPSSNTTSTSTTYSTGSTAWACAQYALGTPVAGTFSEPYRWSLIRIMLDSLPTGFANVEFVCRARYELAFSPTSPMFHATISRPIGSITPVLAQARELDKTVWVTSDDGSSRNIMPMLGLPNKPRPKRRSRASLNAAMGSMSLRRSRRRRRRRNQGVSAPPMVQNRSVPVVQNRWTRRFRNQAQLLPPQPPVQSASPMLALPAPPRNRRWG